MGRHPHELLDVVDDHDNVVGVATRQEIHDQGLQHRAIHLLIATENNEFLLQKRAMDRPTYPGRWDSSASGHVVSGATYEEALRREAEEELGLENLLPIAPALQIEPMRETGYEWIRFFAMRVTHAPKVKPQATEIEEFRWWKEEELLHALVNHEDLFTPSFRILFFLWRETRFMAPEIQIDGWYAIDWGQYDPLQVRRAMLESAGFNARVIEDRHWLPIDAEGGFFGGRHPTTSRLTVPKSEVPDAVALLYLSKPEDGE